MQRVCLNFCTEMQFGRLLCCLVLCSTPVAAEVSIGKRVAGMKKLLARPGWIRQDRLELIGGDRIYRDLNRVFACKGSTVNRWNVDGVIRHVHHYLGCVYGKVLNAFFDYHTGIGLLCRRLADDRAAELLGCLERYLRTIGNGDPLVLRMRGAFQYLHQLSPRMEFKTQVPTILDNYKRFYDGKVFQRTLFVLADDGTVNVPAVLDEFKAFEDVLNSAKTDLGAFHLSHCRVLSNCEYNIVAISICPLIIGSLCDASNFTTERAISRMDDNLATIVEYFILKNYQDLGFTFNPETSATSVA
ncbi:uncharacterized protein LOC126837609 [Adelges cooleyi]|uniref:uncharacterized protein LOC126837609 n=1 Tax=Adelges cooleyi TaxID=133065 RepID=UPI00217FABB3|nr:uncharacterized protein LOC126837609 [Adelges cooleyi]